MNGDVLEEFYQEALEERVIGHISEKLGISLPQAIDLYYNSRLAELIHAGTEDIQYLDYRVLVSILLDTERDLVERYAPANHFELGEGPGTSPRLSM